jgi:hypothetical protein
VKAGLLAALACAGCAPPAEPFPVVAAAELMPLAEDITGPIEILGANSAGSTATDFALHSVAAYHVRLPDAAPRRVVIYDAGSCAIPAPPRTRVVADLQTIRTVGNETHFFADGLLVKGQRMDLDIETAQVELSLEPDGFFTVLGKIVVVQEMKPAQKPPGTYLACGVFAATPARSVAGDRQRRER